MNPFLLSVTPCLRESLYPFSAPLSEGFPR